MIAVIAAIVGGLIEGVKVPLASPLLYALRKRRIFPFAFMAYCIALGFEVNVSNVYAMNLRQMFTLLIPTVLLLDSCLRGERIDRLSIPFIPLLIIGYIYTPIYVFSISLYAFKVLSQDLRGMIPFAAGISLLILSLMLLSKQLNVMGGAATQVVFISSLAIITSIAFWKRVEKVSL